MQASPAFNSECSPSGGCNLTYYTTYIHVFKIAMLPALSLNQTKDHAFTV